MLKTTPNPTFTIPVEVTVPGQEKTTMVRVTFRYKNRDELTDFVKRFGDGRADEEVLDEIIENWQDFEEPYSLEYLTRLKVNYPVLSRELMESYIAASAESRRKNSPR